MSDTVIQVENLGKRYRIGQRESYLTLREAITNAVRAPFARREGKGSQDGEGFIWALKDVSFEVKRGEVLGIIGRNGAGKSTLLKVLTQITEPTEGRATIHGRVASLLEVGTGFHPELTGRENIFLNGAILGMSKREIEREFDEIVAFSEVEKFLDTPVKHYSSGMYVRLAFAVAAHMESEILLIDEVLSVGDAAFQKKCLGRMGEVAKEGRTVLFVSHNMSAIKTLCGSAILMKNGCASHKTGVEHAVTEYLVSASDRTETQEYPITRGDVILHRFAVCQDGNPSDEFDSGKPIDILISYELVQDLTLFRIGFFISTPLGDLIVASLLADWNAEYETMAMGKYEIRCQIPPKYLGMGNYILEVHASRYGIRDYDLCGSTRRYITVIAPSDFNVAHIGEETFAGLLLISPNWTLKKMGSV